ncbi:MAG: hypothetical protein HC899_28185, partial [Leptolyngbyaceae cyanobacterium SM1_4_3]|nr:hypothetical protein [Leptolyngbyaceae cyanobacterium SM1_4_3]
MNISLKLTGAIALAIGAQVALAHGVAASSFHAHPAERASKASAADNSAELVLTADTYQPPDNGGPTSSQGS